MAKKNKKKGNKKPTFKDSLFSVAAKLTADPVSLAKKIMKIFDKMEIDPFYNMKGEKVKIDLKTLVEKEAKGVKFDIISNMVVKKSTDTNGHTDVKLSFVDPLDTIALLDEANPTKTVTIMMSKKKFARVFDYMDSSIVGSLCRCSTLPAIYKKRKAEIQAFLKENWEGTDDLSFYFPVTILLDRFGNVCNPYKVNLVIIIPGPVTKEETKKMTERQIRISTLMNALLGYGCKNVIIEPFDYKMDSKDMTATVDDWKKIVDSQLCQNNFQSITFTAGVNEGFILLKSRFHD